MSAPDNDPSFVPVGKFPRNRRDRLWWGVLAALGLLLALLALVSWQRGRYAPDAVPVPGVPGAPASNQGSSR